MRGWAGASAVAVSHDPVVFSKIQSFFQRKFGGHMPSCPACRYTHWEFAGLLAIPGYHGENAPQTTTTTPVVALVCKRCFYVMQFAWRPIDLGLESLEQPPGGPGPQG